MNASSFFNPDPTQRAIIEHVHQALEKRDEFYQSTMHFHYMEGEEGNDL